MAKKILIILGIWVFLSVLFGFYYVKFGPKRVKIMNVMPIQTGYKAAKEPFKTVGMTIAEIIIKNTKQNTTPFIDKMYEFGATDVVITTEKNESKFKKTLPKVIIGGKTYENKVECTIVSYKYKNKNYEVGTCK